MIAQDGEPTRKLTFRVNGKKDRELDLVFARISKRMEPARPIARSFQFADGWDVWLLPEARVDSQKLCCCSVKCAIAACFVCIERYAAALRFPHAVSRRAMPRTATGKAFQFHVSVFRQ